MLTEKLSSSTKDLFTSKLLGGVSSLLAGDLSCSNTIKHTNYSLQRLVADLPSFIIFWICLRACLPADLRASLPGNKPL